MTWFKHSVFWIEQGFFNQKLEAQSLKSDSVQSFQEIMRWESRDLKTNYPTVTTEKDHLCSMWNLISTLAETSRACQSL